MFLITSPGFITPMEEMPTPDLAVPYAAPMSRIFEANEHATGEGKSIETEAQGSKTGHTEEVTYVNQGS